MTKKKNLQAVLVGASFTLLGPLSCDDGNVIGARSMTQRRPPDGPTLVIGRGCMRVEGGLENAGGGGGGNPEYFERAEYYDGVLTYEYFIAAAASAGDPDHEVNAGNGELVAVLDTDMAFYRSGQAKQVEFDTHDGVHFEVIHWGSSDCDHGSDFPPDAA